MPREKKSPAKLRVSEAPERPFRLFGSMRLNVPEDEFDAWLDENRRSQAELAARKLDTL
jgi:hypothetical protein